MDKTALHIDIETYSTVEIQKSGLYRYADSPDFELLLFGYGTDDEHVKVVDVAQGEDIPVEVRQMLFDPQIYKVAYNAAFEWYCLSNYLDLSEEQCTAWISQWRCTMLHGLYLGYPGGLEKIGKALGLAQEKQKRSYGKALIRYFSMPCRPTKTNGGRNRNLPSHDLERWKLYQEYNRRDVVTEIEVERRLSAFPVPKSIQAEWETDLRINSRGVRVDMELVEGAIDCFAEIQQTLLQESKELTGLSNPQSVAQLKEWLGQRIREPISSLDKDAVQRLLKDDRIDKTTRRVLEIRQELSKSSVKKYQAMRDTVGRRQRIRGLVQYYGANRTGRWAGRLVQVQNLPRTCLTDQREVRGMVKRREINLLEGIYGAIPDTLSQLVRTAFVAEVGTVFVDADFSAIEARILAWLAEEAWRLQVFQGHGKIYEASASQMFGVPLERIQKGNPEYALRQKGKVAELALGYQGGVGALKQMGAMEQGINEEELQGLVTLWRESNPNIVGLWHRMGASAIHVVKHREAVKVGKVTLAIEHDTIQGLSFFTVSLPSGRKLYYPEPFITTNQWGRESLGFWETAQSNQQWATTTTYGGKLVENITQAVARDCLAESIMRLEREGLPVVFHVHDEVVLELEVGQAGLTQVCDILKSPMPWASDLMLTADGWTGTFYTKE